MNSHMPLNVKRRVGDCRIAIVINAMYEYGGLTICCFVDDDDDDDDFCLPCVCSSSSPPASHDDEAGECGLESIE
jgi:hypothetical protein